jgi:hypothetical protein
MAPYRPGLSQARFLSRKTVTNIMYVIWCFNIPGSMCTYVRRSKLNGGKLNKAEELLNQIQEVMNRQTYIRNVSVISHDKLSQFCQLQIFCDVS